MGNYFYPDETPISSQVEFIDYYSRAYFLRNSSIAEERIMNIYDENKLSEEEVFDILAWKTGHINHMLSEIEGKPVYYEGWNKKTLEAKLYKKYINITQISNMLKNIKMGSDNPQDYLNTFDGKGTHIGPVYAMTFMSFNTKGKMPIYDRFACSALWFIIGLKMKFQSPLLII